MLKINVITLFPQLFETHLKELPFKKAIFANLLQVNVVNLRDFAIDKRGTVDDKPYSGGVGMILRVEPLYSALEKVLDKKPEQTPQKTQGRIVMLSPKGKKFDQKMAQEFSQEKEITFICGRYEGIDARMEQYVTDIVSIGDYVVSGGELPAMVIMEAITRLIPGILEKEGAAQIESFNNDTLEYPQYTRPEEFNGLKVPEVLLSGDHKKIEEWKEKNSQPLD